MSSLPTKDLHVWQGAKKDIPITITDGSGKLDLTNYDLIMHIKSTPAGTDVLTLSSTVVTEIEKANQTTNKGQATIHFIPTTASSFVTTRYIYSIWIEHQTDVDDKRPVASGYFYLDAVGPDIVTVIREMLDEAGEVAIQQIKNEVVSPTTVNILYVSRGRIQGVQGVWALTDSGHTGTNYFTGGSYDPVRRKVTLGTNLTSAISDVFIDYTWESGISESTIYQHVVNARQWAIRKTGVTFEYGAASTDDEIGTEQLAIALAIMSCVLTINGANVAQMGYNFKIQEFEIQSKLWGEGMIAQALFNEFKMQIDRALEAVGIDVRSSVAVKIFPRYDLARHISHSGRYNKSYYSTEGSE